MSPDPSLKIRDNEALHRFEAQLSDGSVAVAEYRLRDGAIEFTHTKVPRDHEGKGIGSALIQAGLDAARRRGLKVIPTCPFFDAYMRRHPEVQDLLGNEN